MLRSIVATCVAALCVSLGAPAGGSPVPLTGIVSEDPADFTLRITVGNAPFAAVPLGAQMYVGEAFTQARNASRSLTFARKNLLPFLHVGRRRRRRRASRWTATCSRSRPTARRCTSEASSPP